MHIVVIGSGRVGSDLALQLSEDGHHVVVIDRSREAFRRLGAGFNGQKIVGSGFDREVLMAAQAADADAFAAVTNGDNYTRLTNYVAATLASGMGQYVGQVINQSLFRRIRATQLSFLQAMLGQGLLGSTDGSLPFAVICDTSNNPASRTGLGYVQSDAQVRYQAINEKFIVNIEGGQTVQVHRQTLPGAPGSLNA